MSERKQVNLLRFSTILFVLNPLALQLLPRRVCAYIRLRFQPNPESVVSHCESPDNAAFACGYVIVMVTSQVPDAMDLLLSEFHKACIYTVPKHLVYSEMAGYALYRKYKSQFGKMLKIITDNFLNALRSREVQELKPVIAEIQCYIEDRKFLEEPEGRTLQAALLSSTMVPYADYQESYNRYHYY
ncbi:hypothetical protein JRO89_XS05G0099100 [Xanthoceras sorbifolium]|uniref:mRNA export factor GLE1 n=1 Tax=Xanthoceras sorbifolium TaxID=99658 RepID=A0ABQ8I1N8_9ROSI|nr:hypothetical protein JRO89_XS05G0099100 [Xanthoceras sorbifolium]